MKNWQLKAGIVVLSSALYACFVSARANELGWSLIQVAYGGRQTIIITPKGMHTTDTKNGISMFAKGPSWDVVMFNNQTRKYFQASFKEGLKIAQRRNLFRKIEDAKWHKRGKGAIGKTPASEFIMERTLVPQLNTLAGALSGRSTVTYNSATLWVASEIVAPPQVVQIISTLYGTPDSKGVPLRLTVIQKGRDPHPIVDTIGVSRISVPDSLFVIPKGYKPVKTDMEILMDNDSADSFNDMFGDLDSPTKPSKPLPRKR